MKKRILTVALSILFVAQLFAQLGTVSRADKAFDDFAYAKAAELYVEVVKKGDAPNRVIHNLAQCYRHLRDTKNAEVWYAQAVQLRDRTPDEIYQYAQALKSNEKYAEANNWFRLYNELVPEDRRAIMHLTAGDYYRDLSPVVQKYKISNLTINTPGSEFGAVFFKEKSVVFSSNFDDPSAAVQNTWSWAGGEYLDLYIADRIAGGALNSPQKFSKALNSKYHEGPVCFTDDGLQIFFTRNSDRKRSALSNDGPVNLKIFRATLAGNDYVNIEPLPFCSDEYNVAHPSMSNDGTWLYFSSDMPGGFGGYDLYRVRFDRGFWGRPENLGPQINTEGNENFPFIHRSNTLYFSSDGHVGLGGLDVFKAKLERGQFRNVENLKRPVNSSKDDFSFVCDSAGTYGYFASNRPGGAGSDDIYAFVFEDQSDVYTLQGQIVDQNDFTVPDVKVYVQNQEGAVLGRTMTDEDGFFSFNLNRNDAYQLVTQSPKYSQTEVDVAVFPAGDVKTVTMRVEKSNYSVVGIVREEGTNLKMDNVSVQLIKSSSRMAQETVTGPDGRFSFILDPNATYTVKVVKPGYLAKSKIITTAGLRPGKQLQIDDLFLAPIRLNQIIEIPNVYYDLGKWNIRPDAAEELDKVVEFLNENDGIVVELSSHTDSRGSSEANLELSQKRAQSAVDYIVSKGIDLDRIVAKGYGETQLKNGCKDGVRCSEAEHQINRRTEIKVVAIN